MFVKVLLDLPFSKELTYAVPAEIEDQASVGKRVEVPFRSSKKKTAYIIECVQEMNVKYTIKPVSRIIDEEPLFGQSEIDLAYWMADFYLCSPGEALSLQIPGGRRDKVVSIALAEEDISTAPVENLTEYQERAINEINLKKDKMYYLYGVTGSGKSEVYFRCAEQVIKEGKQVIYLVPEITLTHQLVQQVGKRFEGKVALLHSGMSASQRLSQWRKIKRGEVSIVIGVRSAIFAPFENLGMVIIDEEHENSYKSGQTPRYHARQIAQRKCQKTGATLIMGSATPSLESWKLMNEGRIKRLDLPYRVGNGTIPSMRIVDMLGQRSLISQELHDAIEETLKNKKQVILFLNRRGFSYFFHCKSCGYEMKCPHCSVSLTYHRSDDSMVCHYCGYKTRPIKICPDCHSLDVGYSGFGTEMVEQEIKNQFPFATIDRLDGDVAKVKKNVFKVLDKFKSGETNILLGTQMVAKGFNFPNVELVGIVLADSGINIPDFRSQERTYGLITQVAGRAGRFSDKGKVFIQTFKPRNDAIQYAVHSMSEEFYRNELEVRRETGFPPYARQLNLVIRGRDLEKVESSADIICDILNRLSDQIPSSVGERPEIIGPSECAIAKINNNFRFNILLQHTDIRICQWLVKSMLENYKMPSTLYLEIDVDPLQMI